MAGDGRRRKSDWLMAPPRACERESETMLYLSQVLGRPILDLEGERVATLRDVIVRLGEGDHPPVAGFVARYRRRDPAS